MHSLLGGRDIAINEETGAMVSMRQDVHDALVKPHRPPCDCFDARGLDHCALYGGSPGAGGTHPAPPWVFKLVTQVLRRSGGEKDGGRAIAQRALNWCQGGDPEVRSLALQTFLSTIKGNRLAQLRVYLSQQEADDDLWTRPCVACGGQGYLGPEVKPPFVPIHCKACKGTRYRALNYYEKRVRADHELEMNPTDWDRFDRLREALTRHTGQWPHREEHEKEAARQLRGPNWPLVYQLTAMVLRWCSSEEDFLGAHTSAQVHGLLALERLIGVTLDTKGQRLQWKP